MARTPEDNQPIERQAKNETVDPNITQWETYQFESEYNVPPELVKDRRPNYKRSTAPPFPPD